MADPRILTGGNDLQKTYVADGEKMKTSVAMMSFSNHCSDPRMSMALELANSAMRGYMNTPEDAEPISFARHMCDIAEALHEEAKRRKWLYPVDNSHIDKIYSDEPKETTGFGRD